MTAMFDNHQRRHHRRRRHVRLLTSS